MIHIFFENYLIEKTSKVVFKCFVKRRIEIFTYVRRRLNKLSENNFSVGGQIQLALRV